MTQKSRVFIYLSYLIVFTLLSFSARAEPLDISQSSGQVLLTDQLSFIHADKDLTIHHLLAEPDTIWSEHPDKIPTFSDASQAIWLKFKLINSSTSANERLVVIDFPLINEIDVFLVATDSKQIIQQYHSGVNIPVSDRLITHRSFIFPIEIEPQQQYSLYVSVINDSFTQIPIYIWEEKAFVQSEFVKSIVFGCIFGIILAISLYSLFVYKAITDSCFLYYASYSISFCVFYAALNGFGLQFVWPSRPELSQTFFITFGGFLLVSINLFNIGFLRVKSLNRLFYSAMRSFAGLSFILVLSAWMLPYSLSILLIIVLSIASIFVAIFICIRAVLQGVDGAKRFMLGFGTLGFASLIFIAAKIGMINSNSVTEYSILFGYLVSFLMFFHALMARINIARMRSVYERDKLTSYYQLFHDIYQHAVEAHYTSTDDGRIIRANKAFAELLKFDDLEPTTLASTNMTHYYLDSTDRRQLITRAKEEGRVIGFQTQWRRKDGRNIWVSINLRYEANTMDGNVLIGSIIDITENKRAEKQLEFMATHDSLTGLYNRREFEKRLNNALFTCSDNFSHTLLYMDLDQFKVVNDTCGHKAGDILLRQLTDEFKDLVEDKGTIARLGGDEFGVLLEDCIGDEAFVIAYQIKQVVQDFRFVWDNRVFTLGVSIGMVEVTESNHSIDEVLSIADTACFSAKEQGRNRIHIYTESDEEVKRHHAEMQQVTQINQALENDRFVLEFQFIKPIKNDDELHYELLIRMLDIDGEKVPPNMFLPAAERYNLMAQIDRWVIQHYFSWLEQNPRHMERLGKGSINLSGPSLADDDMELFILNAFETYRIPYNKICFEITESLAITQLDKTLAFIKTFRNLGCKFSLDDFGSGFSSYGYLKNLPVDYLKIDGAFVKDMLIDPIDRAMVKSINEVAKAIGMQTIAEFVECEEILVELKDIGVDYAQGYFINRPRPIAQLLDI